MIYLLDTHVFIWATLETKKLSAKSRDIIFDKNNETIGQSASFL
jgi:PIN domain nuclease of toxin-antitoxin system